MYARFIAKDFNNNDNEKESIAAFVRSQYYEMVEVPMNVNEIFSNSSKLEDQFVEVRGFFVLVGQDGYFVDTIDDRDNREQALKIDVSDIKKVVMRNVPPSGGSEYYYLDEAVVSGNLNRCVEGDFRYAITNVKALTVTKSGETFVAI
jgi:hypothetical protein